MYKNIRALNFSDKVALLSLLMAAAALYFSYQSDQRQRENLVISSDELSLDPINPNFQITKSFHIANISDSVISIKKIDVDLSVKNGTATSRNFEITIADKDIHFNDDLNVVIKPGESITATAKFLPSIGKRASKFISSLGAGNNLDRLRELCVQEGVDLYDNELNDAQRSLCPSFRNYKGSDKLNFSFESERVGDMLMLVVHTYRENTFASEKYLEEP